MSEDKKIEHTTVTFRIAGEQYAKLCYEVEQNKYATVSNVLRRQIDKFIETLPLPPE